MPDAVEQADDGPQHLVGVGDQLSRDLLDVPGEAGTWPLPWSPRQATAISPKVWSSWTNGTITNSSTGRWPGSPGPFTARMDVVADMVAGRSSGGRPSTGGSAAVSACPVAAAACSRPETSLSRIVPRSAWVRLTAWRTAMAAR